MYTTHTCSYCLLAKRLLANNELEYTEVDVSFDHDKRMWLVETTGRRTVPQIFFDDEPIGGFNELAALERSGQLMERLL